MRYVNQRKEEEHSDVSFEARLDSEVKTLYKQLGLGEESHYFLAYRYLHPWFDLAIFWQLKQANIAIIYRLEMMDFKKEVFLPNISPTWNDKIFSDYWQINGHSDWQLP